MKIKTIALVATLGAPLAAFAAETLTVDQSKLTFSVTELRISRGDVVRFTNSDRTSHNLLIHSGETVTDSGLQEPGEPFEMPFARKGSYTVECGIHPKMKMTVIVED